MEFEITLTHQGEKTGTMTGGIQLRTSEGKPTEKLYGESARLLRMRGTRWTTARTALIISFYF